MIRVLIFFAGIVLAAVALGWLADQPGAIKLNWGGDEYGTSIFAFVIALLVFGFVAITLWGLFSSILSSPATLLKKLRDRKQRKSGEALSRGMIAVGAGDVRLAKKYAKQAAKSRPSDPMSALLRAQAAQLAGDRLTVQRIYESMLETPETELLGLRGLYNESSQEQKFEAAQHYAERALKLNAKVSWASEGLLNLQCRAQNWKDALATLATGNLSGIADKKTLKRWKAVLLTARAQDVEDETPDFALEYALDAHALAPDLVPAAELAAHLLANKGNTTRAGQIMRKTWKRTPHPDLATGFAYLRQGDSPRDRMTRIKTLYKDRPDHPESAVAVAHAAVEARDWKEARKALKPLSGDKESARVCTLIARIEDGEFGDKGRVREWLARALRAPRDPVWIADGHISDSWEPVSPLTGKLDVYRWRVPDDSGMAADKNVLLDDFMTLQVEQAGAAASTAIVPVKSTETLATETLATETPSDLVEAKSEAEQTPAAVMIPPVSQKNGSTPASSKISKKEDIVDAEPETSRNSSSNLGNEPRPDDPGPHFRDDDLDPKPKHDPRTPAA